MTQMSLTDAVNRAFYADGITYSPKEDKARLSRQLDAVRDVMGDGQWHALREIADKVGAEPQSVSARLRDFRKERHGSMTVERKRMPGGRGLWLYRLVLP